MKDQICSLGFLLKIIGICYYANLLKVEKLNTIFDHHKTFTKTLFVQQTKSQFGRNMNRHANT